MTPSARPGKPPTIHRHPPTRAEAVYLYYLKVWTQRTKRAPWIRELAAWLNKSNTAVYTALRSLEAKGWVRRVGGDSAIKAHRRFEAVPETEGVS